VLTVTKSGKGLFEELTTTEVILSIKVLLLLSLISPLTVTFCPLCKGSAARPPIQIPLHGPVPSCI